MNVPFSCPSCGASGSVDGSYVGRQVRCKPCGHRFAIPADDDPDPDGYGLDMPAREAPDGPSPGPEPGSVYAPARGGEPPGIGRRPPPARPRVRVVRRDGLDVSWRSWLIVLAVAGLVGLTLVALIAPRGPVIAGSALILVGMAMIVVGYAAGAWGAFSEDFLYGFLYLVIPLYTAYYLVTRWDDLGRWFACSTAGVGFVFLGTQVLRWAGVEA